MATDLAGCLPHYSLGWPERILLSLGVFLVAILAVHLSPFLLVLVWHLLHCLLVSVGSPGHL
jgi:hypothetical protein